MVVHTRWSTHSPTRSVMVFCTSDNERLLVWLYLYIFVEENLDVVMYQSSCEADWLLQRPCDWEAFWNRPWPIQAILTSLKSFLCFSKMQLNSFWNNRPLSSKKEGICSLSFYICLKIDQLLERSLKVRSTRSSLDVTILRFTSCMTNKIIS